MNPHLEAAARAMAGAQWDIDRKAGLVQLMTREEWMDEYWPKIAALLPAALRAMREVPASEAMYLAWLACYGNYVHSEDDLRTQASDTWRALLGAIVDQGGE